jgi:type IV pilus assembly protein PilM
MALPEFFGLDIGNTSVKVALVSKSTGKKPRLEAAGSVQSNGSLIGVQDQNQKKTIAQRIKFACETAGIKTKKAVASLPEAPILSRIIDVPELPEEEMEKVIFFQAGNNLPVSINDVQLDYIPITKKLIQDKKYVTVLLIAAPKNLINSYMEVANMADIELHIELRNWYRQVLTLNENFAQSTMVLDFMDGVSARLLMVKV